MTTTKNRKTNVWQHPHLHFPLSKQQLHEYNTMRWFHCWDTNCGSHTDLEDLKQEHLSERQTVVCTRIVFDQRLTDGATPEDVKDRQNMLAHCEYKVHSWIPNMVVHEFSYSTAEQYDNWKCCWVFHEKLSQRRFCHAQLIYSLQRQNFPPCLATQLEQL